MHHARVVHHTRGRVRLKVPRAKNQPAVLRNIQKVIQSIPDVTEVEISPVTGSVVVHYKGASKQEFHNRLESKAQEDGVFQMVPTLGDAGETIEQIQREAEFLSEHSDTASAIIRTFSNLNKEVKRATGNFVDLNVLVPLGLAAVSFTEIGINTATPLWVSLGMFSFNSFVALHSPTRPGGTQDTEQPGNATEDSENAK